jgi:hypothetical protein
MQTNQTPRVSLSKPLPTKLGSWGGVVVDLSHNDAGIEHPGIVQVGEVLPIVIDAKHRIELQCRISHTQLIKLAAPRQPAIYRSGVVFMDVPDDVSVSIESLLLDEVRTKISEWEANLSGRERGSLPSLHRAKTKSRSSAYHRFRYANKKWTREYALEPAQPVDGFTVCEDEDPHQVAILCEAYRLHDDDGRVMLRMMAHLAIADRK